MRAGFRTFLTRFRTCLEGPALAPIERLAIESFLIDLLGDERGRVETEYTSWHSLFVKFGNNHAYIWRTGQVYVVASYAGTVHERYYHHDTLFDAIEQTLVRFGTKISKNISIQVDS